MRRIMGVVALVLALSSCGGTSEPEADAKPMSEWEKQQAAASDDPDAYEASEEPVELREPTLDDFVLDVRTKEKKCFGSAGCNLTVVVEPTMTDLTLLTGRTVELTYEIRGVEDGPLVATVEFDEEGKYMSQEHFVGTNNSGAKLRAKPTYISVR